MQLYGHQIGNDQINQEHHIDLIAHSVRVDFSQMRGDNLSTPPGSYSAGDTFVIDGTPTGEWSDFEDGDVVQTTVDSGGTPSWVLVADDLTADDVCRVAGAGLSGSFTGHTNQIGKYDGAAWGDWLSVRDGLHCVEYHDSASPSVTQGRPFIYAGSTAAWERAGAEIDIASADHVLEIDELDRIGHRDHVGHSWGGLYNRGLMMGTVTTEPTPPMVGLTYLYTGAGATWDGTAIATDNYVYYRSATPGNKWLVIGTRVANDLMIVPPPALTPVGAFAGQGNMVAIWDGSAWEFVTPVRGDVSVPGGVEVGGTDVKWRGTSFYYDGTEWRMLAIDPTELNDISDGCISWNDVYNSLEVTVQANGGVQRTTGGLQVGPTASTQNISASNPVADKAYVDAAIEGFDWQRPVSTKQGKGTADSAPGTPAAGDSWIVGTAWGAFATGDLVEYSGTAWVLIVAGVTGEPPTGTRVLVDASPAGSDIWSSYANYIVEYDGAAWQPSPAAGPADGFAVMVAGDSSVNENTQWVFDEDDAVWVQVGAASVYTAGFGLNLAGSQFSVDWLTASATPTTGTTWDTGLGSTIDIDKALLFRNGVLQKKVAAAPGAGEYTWSAGTATFGTTFDPGGEYCYIVAPGV